MRLQVAPVSEIRLPLFARTPRCVERVSWIAPAQLLQEAPNMGALRVADIPEDRH